MNHFDKKGTYMIWIRTIIYFIIKIICYYSPTFSSIRIFQVFIHYINLLLFFTIWNLPIAVVPFFKFIFTQLGE